MAPITAIAVLLVALCVRNWLLRLFAVADDIGAEIEAEHAGYRLAHQRHEQAARDRREGDGGFCFHGQEQ